jgi:hypothetical protein
VVRSHGILNASVGIVSVVHGDVAITIAQLRRASGARVGLAGSGSGVVDRELIKLVAGGLLGRRGLLRLLLLRWLLAHIVPRRLGGAIVTSRGARGIIERLPLRVHGSWATSGRVERCSRLEGRVRPRVGRG